jgi:hypothetical protein
LRLYITIEIDHQKPVFQFDGDDPLTLNELKEYINKDLDFSQKFVWVSLLYKSEILCDRLIKKPKKKQKIMLFLMIITIFKINLNKCNY